MRQLPVLAAVLSCLAACADGPSAPGTTRVQIDGESYSARTLESYLWRTPDTSDYSYLFRFATEDAEGNPTEFSISLHFPDERVGEETRLTVENHELTVEVSATHCGGFGQVSCDSDLAGVYAWMGTFQSSGAMLGDATLHRLSLSFAAAEESFESPASLELDFEGTLRPSDCFSTDDCQIELAAGATTP